MHCSKWFVYALWDIVFKMQRYMCYIIVANMAVPNTLADTPYMKLAFTFNIGQTHTIHLHSNSTLAKQISYTCIQILPWPNKYHKLAFKFYLGQTHTIRLHSNSTLANKYHMLAFKFYLGQTNTIHLHSNSTLAKQIP